MTCDLQTSESSHGPEKPVDQLKSLIFFNYPNKTWRAKYYPLPPSFNIRHFNPPKTRRFFFFFKILCIYLFMRDTQREAETQAEGEAGSLREPWCRTPCQDPGDHDLSQRQLLNPWATQLPHNTGFWTELTAHVVKYKDSSHAVLSKT